MQSVDIQAAAPALEDNASDSLTPSAMEYFLACAFPCSICCSNRGKALAASADGDVLVGLDDLEYCAGVIRNSNIDYEWTVESFSYEKRRNHDPNSKSSVSEYVSHSECKQFGFLTSVDASPTLPEDVARKFSRRSTR